MTEKTFSMNKWALVALVVLCWAIAASFKASQYSYQYTDLLAKVKNTMITANLGLDYGNGSATRWFNGTRISAGSTLLSLTELVASVNYTRRIHGWNNEGERCSVWFFDGKGYVWVWNRLVEVIANFCVENHRFI